MDATRPRLLCREGPSAELRARLPHDHVLAELMDEHLQLLSQLARLEELARGPGGAASPPFAEMEAIARRLEGAEPHHQREEQVLFPALTERGLAGPPRMMEHEHVELRARKHRVRELAAQAAAGDPAAPASLRREALGLVAMLREHIHKEDEILYPMAFETIEASAWADMRRRCDAIGTCCGRHGPGAH
jgi:hemerythrin-like domain-containing protein